MIYNILKTIENVLNKDKIKFNDKSFYSPTEWQAKGYDDCKKAILIITHEGETLGDYFSYGNLNYGAINKMDKELEKLGYYAESQTSWYTAIYKI